MSAGSEWQGLNSAPDCGADLSGTARWPERHLAAWTG